MKAFAKYLSKNKFFLSFLAVMAVLFIACLVMAIKPKKEMFFPLSGIELSEDDYGDYLLKSGIKLSPGTWSFKVSFSAESEAVCFFTLRDENTKESLLWFNGSILYPGLNEASFTAYCFTNTDTVDFIAKHQNSSFIAESLTVSETPFFWTRLAVIVLLVFLAGLYLSYVVYSFKYKQLTKEDKYVIVFVNLIWIIASIPLLHRGIFFGGDLTYHILRIDGVKEAIVNGYFPVKLEPQWQQGYGYAQAVFYCPMFLYVPALFELAGFYISEVVIIFYIFMNLATSWIAYYSYSRILHNKIAGIIGAAVYVLSIYRINTLYHIGMVGVGSAMVFLPLILLSIWRLIFEKKEGPFTAKDWLPLAIGFAGVIQSHVLSSEIAFFLTLITCIIHVVAIIKRKGIPAFLKAVAVAVGLCIWFLIPFLDYYINHNIVMKNIGARQIQSQGFYLAQHLVLFATDRPFQGTQFSHPLGIGLFAVLVLLVCIALAYTGRLKAGTGKELYSFVKYSLTASTILFLLTLNVFPWDKLQRVSSLIEPLIGNIQYPHRFQAWVFVFVSMLVGFLYIFLSEQFGKSGGRAVLCSIVLSVAFSSTVLVFTEVKMQDRITLYNLEAMGSGYTAGDQYNMLGTNPDLFTYGRYAYGEGLNVISKDKGALKAEAVCENSNNSESWIEFPLIYYKGYIADSDVGRLQVESGNNSVVRVIVPANFSGKINVRYTQQWYWVVAEVISTGFYWSLIAFGVITMVKNRRRCEDVCKTP